MTMRRGRYPFSSTIHVVVKPPSSSSAPKMQPTETSFPASATSACATASEPPLSSPTPRPVSRPLSFLKVYCPSYEAGTTSRCAEMT